MRKQILTAEYIGKFAEIIDKNTLQIISTGIIIDETKNTFQLKNEKGEKKKIIKKEVFIQTHFQIQDKIQKIKIDGQLLMKRSEDRVKIK